MRFFTRHRHVSYPGAGHHLYHPAGLPIAASVTHGLTGGFYALGGTPEGSARASAAAWRATIEFLTEAMGRPAPTTSVVP